MRNKRILDIIEQSKKSHNNKTTLFLEKYIKYYNMEVIDNYILYESFYGQGFIDNPYGLFKAFLTRDDFYDYTHIWVLDNFDINYFMITELSDYPNVVFVKYGSDEYLKYLSTSKYLINNCTFQPYFTKKDEQVYINTWHGITIKKLGYDVKNSNIDLGNTIRNFLSVDYHVTANEHMTNVLKNGYKLDGLYNGCYIEEGQPRIDLFDTKKSYVIEKLKSFGVSIDPNKKIILYAPTWSGTLSNPSNIDIHSIDNIIDKNKYQILYKLHHVNYKKDPKFVPPAMDTNELLTICDLLITDYSSIQFDAMTLRIPVIRYICNNKYESEHGLYFNLSCNIAHNIDTLKVLINHYDRLKIETYTQNKCASKILSIIFDKKNGNIIKPENNKIKLLFYVGDFKPNGVTTSFLSLVNNIDYEKYDVSLITLNKKEKWYIDLINNIPKEVRVLCRAGTYSQTLMEECAKNITLKLGIGTDYLFDILPRDMYKREFKRCFGISEFDKLINFTGYSPFYSYLFMHGFGEKIVWLHNDMILDRDRETNGIKTLYDTLSSVFTTYKYYDRLISVSKEVMKINMKNFPFIEKDKFKYAHNTLDYKKILYLSELNNEINIDKTKINFVTCGRLSYAKNFSALIDAFNDFSKDNSNCELYIIGNGELENELRKKCGKSIHMIKYDGNPFSLMKKCDCFIFPSLYEGQGIALMEARVLGLPIIISDLPKMKGIFYKNGQYNIKGFDSDAIKNGLNAFIKGNVKNKRFNYEKYNRESYKEFEVAICE